jgi:membrane fusion protein, multidrug efflux system
VILARSFREGSEVRAGEVLYRIDPRTYEVALLGARARLAESEARLYAAERRLRRLLGLLAYGAVAKVEVDEAAAVVKQAQAAVADGQAAVGQARKDLDDTVAGPHYYTSIPGTPSFAPPKVGLRRPS